jgi:hypothetical protein
MTTRPYASDLPPTIARPHAGRLAGNVAVPDLRIHPREATCRKDRFIA